MNTHWGRYSTTGQKRHRGVLSTGGEQRRHYLSRRERRTKRREMKVGDWLALAREIARSGKQVVISRWRCRRPPS